MADTAVAMADTAVVDTDYVRRTVLEALGQGLAAVTAVQPRDPVDELGRWLIRHADGLVAAREVGGTMQSSRSR
jgi:hypothetical protein